MQAMICGRKPHNICHFGPLKKSQCHIAKPGELWEISNGRYFARPGLCYLISVCSVEQVSGMSNYHHWRALLGMSGPWKLSEDARCWCQPLSLTWILHVGKSFKLNVVHPIATTLLHHCLCLGGTSGQDSVELGSSQITVLI